MQSIMLRMKNGDVMRTFVDKTNSTIEMEEYKPDTAATPTANANANANANASANASANANTMLGEGTASHSAGGAKK